MVFLPAEVGDSADWKVGAYGCCGYGEGQILGVATDHLHFGYAEHVSVAVDNWSTAISWTNGRRELDVVESVLVPQGRDDAAGDGSFEAQW
jgi:hypothetical protein